MSDAVPDPHTLPGRIRSDRAAADQVAAMLDRLDQPPVEQRAAVRGHRIEGLTFEALARREGCTKSTAKRWHDEGFEQLRAWVTADARHAA
ncbi:MAG: hypothetical protein C0501_30650 [Isosphaera sp.]|nr:hypothetical protein [Isosphaera sp.]